METQLAIEQECLRSDPAGNDAAKALLGLAWTVAALATFMPLRYSSAKACLPELASSRQFHCLRRKGHADR